MHALFVARSAVLLALAMVVQMLGLPQLVTGSVVNTVLYMTALAAPPLYGVAVGCLTPVIALLRGILAAPAAPLVPFIAVGNGVLVLIFWLFYRRMHWQGRHVAGVVVASVVKAGWLAVAAGYLVHVPAKLVATMQWPQLVTALIGGAVTLVLLPVLRPWLNKQAS